MPGIDSRAPERTDTSSGSSSSPSFLPACVLQPRQRLVDLVLEPVRLGPVGLHVGHARLGGDGEAGRHPLGAQDAGHLGHVGALAPQQVPHVPRALGEVVHELRIRGHRQDGECMPVSEQITLARHGETDWSRAGRHTGRTDVPLNERGREQAAALTPRLAGIDFALVLTSPLSRAADTCRLAGLGDAAEPEPALHRVGLRRLRGPDQRPDPRGRARAGRSSPTAPRAARRRTRWARGWTP